MDRKERWFYIVNPSGTIHIVSEEHAKARLAIVGWRLATEEERKAYVKADGNQRFNKPLATPFTPMPADEAELQGAEYVPDVAGAEAKFKSDLITPKKNTSSAPKKNTGKDKTKTDEAPAENTGESDDPEQG